MKRQLQFMAMPIHDRQVNSCRRQFIQNYIVAEFFV